MDFFVCIFSLKDIQEQIVTASIKFTDFEKIIGRTYRDQYENMIKELNILGIPPKIISVRVNQLQKYRHLGLCVNGAKVILKFADQFKLKGDYEQIRNIAKVSFLLQICAQITSKIL